MTKKAYQNLIAQTERNCLNISNHESHGDVQTENEELARTKKVENPKVSPTTTS